MATRKQVIETGCQIVTRDGVDHIVPYNPPLPELYFIVVEYVEDAGYIFDGPWDTAQEAKDEVLPQLHPGARWMILKPVECSD